MTEIMLQMIALVLQGVKAFVFDFPTGATGADQQHDVIPGNEAIGDPAIGIMNALVAVPCLGGNWLCVV
jgi:cytochrome c biogenesis protein CcdA